MDLMYVTSRKYDSKLQYYNDFMNTCHDDTKGLVRISQNNIAAWITKYELTDTEDLSLKYRVYVADLNMPWDFHTVVTSDDNITLLEWDLFGECLLIGDDFGSLSLWTFQNNVFNSWKCLGKLDLRGETMVAGAFFHTGRKLIYNADKKDSVLYHQKYTPIRYKPTVYVAGGTALNGCVVLTSTGLVAVCVLPSDSLTPMITQVECLSSSSCRNKITVVDIAYAANGSIIVVTSCGGVRMPIRCYELSITYTNRKSITINSRPLAGFILNFSTLDDNGRDWCITSLKFVVKDIINSLIVILNNKNNNTSMVQLWDFVIDESQENISPDELFKMMKWEQKNSYVIDNIVVSITTTKMLMSNNPNPSSYIILVLRDSRIKVLNRNLNEELVYNVNNFWDNKDIKKTFNDICLTGIDISWMGNIVVSVDNIGNIYVVQIQNAELNAPITLSHAVTMLEYCLVSGLDFWDVAMSLKPQMLEMICERMGDNFNKQPVYVQQNDYGAFLIMKAFLYRMSSNSIQKHSDLLSLLMLYSISVTFKSFIHPQTVNANIDKGPGDILTSALSDISSIDINHVIVNIEAKDFIVDSLVSVSFQQLIQWVAHLALNILYRIPDHHKTSGYDIVADNHALNILREIMVIIYLWSFVKPQCSPIFMKIGQFNGLPKLFNLISRLMICNQNGEMDENLIDDCYLLQNQVSCPKLSLTASEICDVASPAFYREALPLQFTFGIEPETISFELDSSFSERSAQNIRNTDIIKLIHFGESNPHLMKQCNRCQGKTQVVNSNKSWAMRSWEDRWICSCICGGKWRFIKSTAPMKLN